MAQERVAIYCRLSEEDKNKNNPTDDSGSIQNQKNMLLSYASEQQWDVYQIYSDDDYAGADRNRPAFCKLIEDAKLRRFDIVLCKTQSRFTRELELVEHYIHGLFPALGIRFVSIVDNADTANSGNKKSRQINGLINEWYLEDMSDNIRSVLTDRRKNGKHIGSFAVYGYQKDPDEKGHLIIDPEAAQIVREVFTLFAQGNGKTSIARELNRRGIPNPTEYKRQKGLRYAQPKRQNATLWKYFAISDMLINEAYIGNMVQGKYGSVSYKTKVNKPRPKEEWIRVEGTHEAIIPRELWDRVQSMIAQKAKPFSGGEVGIFARKVRCADCGYTMRSAKSRGRYYLQCSNRAVDKDSCGGSFIPVTQLEEMVLAELNQLAQQYLDHGAVMRSVSLTDRLSQRRQKQEGLLVTYQKELENNQSYFRSLYVDKVKGILSEEDFAVLSHEFGTEKHRLERCIKFCEEELQAIALEEAADNHKEALLAKYLHPDRLTREMVEILIDHIVVYKRKPGAKCPEIEIHWNF